MIPALAGLLACQLAGEILVRALMLPLPGPVAGLGLLFGFLLWRGRSRSDPVEAIPPDLGKVCDALLKNLSLLFIPAAVGVVQYLDLLRRYAGAIALTIAASTLLALILTAATFRLASRLHAFRHRSLLGDIAAAIDEEHHP